MNIEDKTDEIRGCVKKIIFHAPGSGFTVISAETAGREGAVTVVCNSADIKPGENYIFSGYWTKHPRFGRQLKAESCVPVQPDTLEGIEKYLGSGLIKGIGPRFAGRIVKKFGLKTLDVLEQNPERIRQVEGIGRKRADMILSAWDHQRALRHIMVFLYGLGIGPARAVRIYKEYGPGTPERIKENPYRLSVDIWGIGFKVADAIAGKMGFAPDSPQRARAGIHHVLSESAQNGHCFLSVTETEKECEKLNIPVSAVKSAISELTGEGAIVADEDFLFLKRLYTAETESARLLSDLLKANPGRKILPDINPRSFAENIGLNLSDGQTSALETALREKVAVITGGPGVGKTTILSVLVGIMQYQGWNISLCSPTGRAAKRMTEAIGIEAKTIHRMLKFSSEEGRFKVNAMSPLNTDCVIVDEMSMVDVEIFSHLLKAIPHTAKLIMVGDADQLPSVGPGTVLRDLIDSRRIPVCRLADIYRQAEESRIILNAHRVNRGEFPLSDRENSGELSDFYFIPQDDPEKIEELIIRTVTERIPQRFGLNPLTEVQVISPMRKGNLGVNALNQKLKSVLNPRNDEESDVGGFHSGDRIMQIRNNYDRDVYNGDMGRILSVDTAENTITADFDGLETVYDLSDLDEIVLAYACTVHKSQGSEFPAVVIPLHTSHFILLQRNLLYTAITRAKKLAVIVGSQKALAIAVKNDKINLRNSRLKERLMAEIRKQKN